MAKITHIIVHCSDSNWGDVHFIRRWHKERGWSDIGYHFVICNGKREPKAGYLKSLLGAIQEGIRLDQDSFIRGSEVGRHALGYNARSIGICLIGKDKFEVEQYIALRNLLVRLTGKHGIPVENVLGHCETESGKAQGKTCPNIDMDRVRKQLREASAVRA